MKNNEKSEDNNKIEDDLRKNEDNLRPKDNIKETGGGKSRSKTITILRPPTITYNPTNKKKRRITNK